MLTAAKVSPPQPRLVNLSSSYLEADDDAQSLF